MKESQKYKKRSGQESVTRGKITVLIDRIAPSPNS